MSVETDAARVRGRLLGIRVMAGALIAGVLVFLGVVVYLVHGEQQGQGAQPAAGLPVITLIAGLVFLTNLPLAILLPVLITRSAVRRIAAGAWRGPPGADPAQSESDVGKLVAVWQTSTLVGYALLEGAGFFGCIAYLLEGQGAALGVAGAALGMMAGMFPTAGRLGAWLQRQSDALAALRNEAELSGR
jgi:hypothetical protein